MPRSPEQPPMPAAPTSPLGDPLAYRLLVAAPQAAQEYTEQRREAWGRYWKASCTLTELRADLGNATRAARAVLTVLGEARRREEILAPETRHQLKMMLDDSVGLCERAYDKLCKMTLEELQYAPRS